MRRAGALILLLCCVLLSSVAQAQTQVAGPFYYRFGEATPARAEPGEGWTRVLRLADVPKRGGASLWVVTRIDDAEGPRPSLMVPAVYVRFLAYLDGELIGGDDSDAAAGRSFHLVPLESGGGGWLSLHVTSDYTKTGFRGDLAIGDEAALVTSIVRRDAARAALVVIFLLVAIGALALAALREERLAYAGLGLWSACAAIWTLFYTGVRDLLFPAPRFWIAAWAVSLAGATPSLLLYLRGVLDLGDARATRARLMDGLIAANALSSAVGLALFALDVAASTTNVFLYLHRTLLGVTAVTIAVFLGIGARRGDEEARVLAAGMAVYMAVAVRDVLVSLAVLDEAQVMAPWGIFVLVACAAWVLRRRVDKLRQRALLLAGEVIVHAREREMMLRDMHDGLGRITTTISMLTEVARRDRESEMPLNAISALAREGSDEIRTFMRGLDAVADDWPSLIAILRDRATALVDALGGSYRLETDVADGAPAPSPYLLVHLLRVFQEGLTNALKHADAPAVVASLSVHEDGVTLRMLNDRIRDAPRKRGTGIDMGAGLANMRARALDLGGALALEHDPDAGTMELVLQIPLPLAYDGAADAEQSGVDADRDRRG